MGPLKQQKKMVWDQSSASAENWECTGLKQDKQAHDTRLTEQVDQDQDQVKLMWVIKKKKEGAGGATLESHREGNTSK